MADKLYLGIFEGHFDPAVGAVKKGEVIAFAEEERFTRQKHAVGVYPSRALKFCLDQAGAGPEDVSAIAVNWNVEAYSNGEMAAFFDQLNADWPIDGSTRRWQQSMLSNFSHQAVELRHLMPWRRLFGAVPFPGIRPVPHHYTHALHAYLQSPFDDALCMTIDGSGDQHCTVLWDCRDGQLTPIREICMPHSLGWFYAAFTEYLGFEAYDGEYKVMGLAAYGAPDETLRALVQKVLFAAPDDVEYRIDPTFIHFGSRSWSDRFTDRLPDLFGRPRRLADEPIDEWHHNLAFAVQEALETAVERLAIWGLEKIGSSNLCIGGGVGLNVKMNSRLFALDAVDSVFAHPLCGDGPAAVGAALAASWHDDSDRPERLRSLALGNEQSDAEIESILRLCQVDYEASDDVAAAAAEALADGAVVGWFQGRMEAGPRALGQRSILADPRKIEARDRVNAVIKYREFWRPFCPSMIAEVAPKYLKSYCDAPFMIISFEATEALKRDAPAVVHVDGTTRVQLVEQETHPLYHRLLSVFGELTGVPVLLNTSFNVKGEPIVCTANDALRTFYATGMDVLALGCFLVCKKPAR